MLRFQFFTHVQCRNISQWNRFFNYCSKSLKHHRNTSTHSLTLIFSYSRLSIEVWVANKTKNCQQKKKHRQQLTLCKAIETNEWTRKRHTFSFLLGALAGYVAVLLCRYPINQNLFSINFFCCSLSFSWLTEFVYFSMGKKQFFWVYAVLALSGWQAVVFWFIITISESGRRGRRDLKRTTSDFSPIYDIIRS